MLRDNRVTICIPKAVVFVRKTVERQYGMGTLEKANDNCVEMDVMLGLVSVVGIAILVVNLVGIIYYRLSIICYVLAKSQRDR